MIISIISTNFNNKKISFVIFFLEKIEKFGLIIGLFLKTILKKLDHFFLKKILIKDTFNNYLEDEWKKIRKKS